jgi:hypothetical protein
MDHGTPLPYNLKAPETTSVVDGKHRSGSLFAARIFSEVGQAQSF